VYAARRKEDDSVQDRIWWWLVPVVVLCGVAGAFYFTHRSHEREEIVTTPAQPAARQPEAPAIQHPVPATVGDTPLPELDASDEPLLQALSSLIGGSSVQELFVPTQLIRHIVATVDNLPRKKVAPQALPVKPVPGAFAAKESGSTLTVSPQNAARYGAWIHVAEAVDAEQLATLYFRYYPLFQEAYRNLGYPSGYFNDRLVEAIDDALAAPEVKEPIDLVQPSVLYQYADPELESRSAGQKVLIRMGNQNATKLKRKLREVRAAITQQRPSG
jgi:hypothetical protein